MIQAGGALDTALAGDLPTSSAEPTIQPAGGSQPFDNRMPVPNPQLLHSPGGNIPQPFLRWQRRP